MGGRCCGELVEIRLVMLVGASVPGLPEGIGDEEGEFEGLIGVEAGVAEGMVALGEVIFGDFLGAAGAFGDVFTGHFDVDAAGISAVCLVGGEVGMNLFENVVEGAGLEAAGAGDGVPVHGVAGPEDVSTFGRDACEEGREVAGDVVGAHADDDVEASGNVIGVEAVDELDEFVGSDGGAGFESDGVGDAAEEFDVGAFGVASAVADPKHVGGGIEPLAGVGVLTGEGLFVIEKEGFVGSEEAGLGEVGRILRGDAADLHEGEGFLDLSGELLVAFALGVVFHDVAHPFADIVEVGGAAAGEIADDVEGGDGLVVGADDALWIGGAGGFVEIDGVNDVAAEAGEGRAVSRFVIAGAWLGELAGEAGDFYDGAAAGEGEDDGHLEEDFEEASNVVGAELGESFGAIAALEEEGAALGDFGEVAR
jgi:hypothetical protein